MNTDPPPPILFVFFNYVLSKYFNDTLLKKFMIQQHSGGGYLKNHSNYSMLILARATHRNDLVRTSWVLIDEASKKSFFSKYRDKS